MREETNKQQRKLIVFFLFFSFKLKRKKENRNRSQPGPGSRITVQRLFRLLLEKGKIRKRKYCFNCAQSRLLLLSIDDIQILLLTNYQHLLYITMRVVV